MKTSNQLALTEKLSSLGLEILAIAPLLPEDGLEPYWRSILLIGPKPKVFWPVFQASKEAQDGLPDPLDRWSLHYGATLAADYKALAVYPFRGPPYPPFITWALRSGAFFSSPMGLLLHQSQGLWASFRFGLAVHTDRQPPTTAESPCLTCSKPCQTACPVQAFTFQKALETSCYDDQVCADYLHITPTAACHTGCLVRAACPVGQNAKIEPERAEHHMAVFMAQRKT